MLHEKSSVPDFLSQNDNMGAQWKGFERSFKSVEGDTKYFTSSMTGKMEPLNLRESLTGWPVHEYFALSRIEDAVFQS
jgi:hypothetical protein